MTLPPHVPAPGDVVVRLPHTLTRATRDRLDADARAALPHPAGVSRWAPDPRLVLDAGGCAVADAAGAETLAALGRAAAARGAGVVVVDPSPELRALLDVAAARAGVAIPVAARDAPPAAADPVVLPLDDDARARLRARRRRR